MKVLLFERAALGCVRLRSCISEICKRKRNIKTTLFVVRVVAVFVIGCIRCISVKCCCRMISFDAAATVKYSSDKRCDSFWQ